MEEEVLDADVQLRESLLCIWVVLVLKPDLHVGVVEDVVSELKALLDIALIKIPPLISLDHHPTTTALTH